MKQKKTWFEKKTRFARTGALLLAGILLLTGCGNAAAAAMRLTKTDGAVDVISDKGKDLSVRKDMKLYSGYQVGTDADSYAWMDLDKVKLAKLDEDSDAVLRKDGKDLEIVIKAGSLFFEVTEPLADDESMEIRTSTMAIGIRGTCGWVRLVDDGHMQVYILEGTVHCTVTDPASGKTAEADVSAGEMADLILRSEGQGEPCEIIKQPFGETDIPVFVQGEPEVDKLTKQLAQNAGKDAAKQPAGNDAAKQSKPAGGDALARVALDLSGYESYGYAYGGVVPVKKDGKWGAVNYQNEVIVPFAYDDFWVPDNLGNLVMKVSPSEYDGQEFLGIDEDLVSFALFDANGKVLYQGKNPVCASGGMYILLLNDGQTGHTTIEYHRPDGTLVQAVDGSYGSWINGFYEGVSSVYREDWEAKIFEVGEMNENGDITWRTDPEMARALAEGNQSDVSVLYKQPLSTISHGYYLAGNVWQGDPGFYDMRDENYRRIGEFYLYSLKLDGKKLISEFRFDDDTFLDEGDSENDLRGFYHDGAYMYNYGSNMVWTIGEQDVLVDLSRYPGMTAETVDDRIVKAVYDKIFMRDENYWLVKKGDKWGYIDHDGKEAALFADASDFHLQRALVIEEGTAYLINEKFEKLQDLGKADGVAKNGELFVVVRGDVKEYYQFQ